MIHWLICSHWYQVAEPHQKKKTRLEYIDTNRVQVNVSDWNKVNHREKKPNVNDRKKKHPVIFFISIYNE
jgi:hypothetical protein